MFIAKKRSDAQRQTFRTGLLAAALVLGLSPAHAEPGKLAIEFNDLQPTDKGCRAVFVVNNGLGKPLEADLRIVAFDKEGHAKLFLSLSVGPLPVNKTRVLRFDLGEGTDCAGFGRFVLDDVTRCVGPEVKDGECLEALSLSSRAGPSLDF